MNQKLSDWASIALLRSRVRRGWGRDSRSGKQFVAVSTGSSLATRALLALTPELWPGAGNNLFVYLQTFVRRPVHGSFDEILAILYASCRLGVVG